MEIQDLTFVEDFAKEALLKFSEIQNDQNLDNRGAFITAALLATIIVERVGSFGSELGLSNQKEFEEMIVMSLGEIEWAK